jgi:hypothetical protein
VYALAGRVMGSHRTHPDTPVMAVTGASMTALVPSPLRATDWPKRSPSMQGIADFYKRANLLIQRRA